jgi:GNAT superfamily N-acetyltransferase
LKITKATPKHLPAILELETMLIGNKEDHTELIKRSVKAGECYVALIDDKVVGAAILNYTFYNQGWLDLINVNPEYRRRGIGSALLKHLEKICKTSKFFTSANQSNVPARKTYEANGFVRSGYVDNLDEADTEIIYFKSLSNK